MNEWFFFSFFSSLSCIQIHRLGQQLILVLFILLIYEDSSQLCCLYDLSVSYNVDAAVCTSVTLFLKMSQ